MKPVAIDLETRLFGAGNLAPRPIVISITDSSGNRLSKDWRGEALRLLSDKQTIFIGHNIAYDMACIYHHAPETRKLIWCAYDEGRVSDTGIRDRILHESCPEFFSRRRGKAKPPRPQQVFLVV